jgi:AraC-like DNA-binding protein
VKKTMLQPDLYNTSIAGWSFALFDALNSYGIDASQVFGDVGIDLNAVSSPAARLPVDSVQQVWRYADENTDDYFGVHVSEFLTPASLHALGFALWSSSTLKDYFDRYIRYRCVLSHRHFCELIENEDSYTLSLVDERNIKSEITQDAALGFFLRMARRLSDPEFSPRAVHVTRSLGAGADRLQSFYNSDIYPESATYAVHLDKKEMEKALRFANPTLAAQQDTLVERYISEQGLISEYMLRVRTEIQSLLDSGSVSIESVAEKMAVTVRTLQRRLSDEKCSYNELLDEVRKQLALEYTRDAKISATEAAFKLGFNDSGSFGRSFKRWTGQSFTGYRGTLRK